MGRQSGHGESHRLGDKNELYGCYELIISIVMMKWRVLGLGERCAGQGHLDRDTGFWLNINCGYVLLPWGGGVLGHFQQLVRRTWRETPASGRILIVMCCYHEVEVWWKTSYSWEWPRVWDKYELYKHIAHWPPSLIVEIFWDTEVENVAGEVWLVTPGLGE